ncbi:hypothetical protein [Nannocystis bainbridge]|uniref:Secreted protein n=1 Tax=Nannocystis bainbridge TaxID=2995303 RepID=A0ABT5DSC7_9BACT|nr:hypothetical protein [Nannocystis bainbridge]MDC0716075.1 hypothetical protein [Nannocystis bainbridge]
MLDVVGSGPAVEDEVVLVLVLVPSVSDAVAWVVPPVSLAVAAVSSVVSCGAPGGLLQLAPTTRTNNHDVFIERGPYERC